MKVLHIIPSLGYGGAERLLVDLLPRIAATGIDVQTLSVTSVNPLAPLLRQRSIVVGELGFQGTIYSLAALTRAAARARRVIELFQPDIVHSHLYLGDLVARLAAPGRVRLMTTLHAIDDWWEQHERLQSRLKTWLDRGLADWRATRAIAVSDAVADAATKASIVQPMRCRVVPNGIDERRFQYRSRTLREDPNIIQVGRFYTEKGHAIAIQAFRILLDSRPDARLTFVGSGPQEQSLKELAVRLGVRDRLKFLGERSDIPELLATAHVFWMPSLREGLGIACLEAMASGVPVVASRTGGLAEILSGDRECLVPPGDAPALARITAGILDDYSAALGGAGSRADRIVRDYSVERTAAAYAFAYRDLLGGEW